MTGAILADLIVGPPEFDVAVDGRPVLDGRERSHMVDVRNVLLPAATLFGAAAALLAVAVTRHRRSPWLWRAIGRGATILLALGVAVGLAILLFFDAAFLLFHLVVFPQGNFSFDPRTQRLTQMLPEQLWTETSLAMAAVGLAMAAAVSLLARRRAARLADRS